MLGYSWQGKQLGDGLQANNTNFVSDYTGYYNLGLGNYNAVNGYVVDFGNTVFQTTDLFQTSCVLITILQKNTFAGIYQA